MKQEVRISLNLVELAAGVLRILSFLLLAAAGLTTAALVMMTLRMPASDSLWYLMHEMDEALFGAFFFWGGFAVVGYLARMLGREVTKAQKAQPVQSMDMEQTQPIMPVYQYPQPICSSGEETTEQQ